MGAPILIAALLSGPVVEAVAVERLLGDLGRLRAEFKTLRVTFTLTRTDAVFRKTETFDGTLAMLNDAGTVYGSLRVEPAQRPDEAETYVLRGDDLFCSDARTRTTRKLSPPKGGALKYAAEWGHAALWLLDPAEARERCDIRLLKRDGHHDYFTVKTAQPSAFALVFGLAGKPDVREYRLAVSRQASPSIPAGVVRKVAVIRPDGDAETYTVTSWARDGHTFTPKDFPAPAGGWKVKP